jgi:alcohol dehydrogenase (NADP+)
VSVPLPIDDYLELLSLNGTLVIVGLPPEPLSVDASTLTDSRRSFAGSSVGGIGQTQEMLEFCAAHGLGAEIEVITGGQIDQAYERVVNSDVRYRFVLDTATF